jgi:glycosyltransferase involved in cell wall biosynthesis
MTPSTKPLVCIVGGPDVDARLDFMRLLRRDFGVCAAGTDARLAGAFAEAGVPYRHYGMSRRANPVLDAYAVWQLLRIFRAERPAVVHAFDTKPAVWARIAARLAGVPVVIGTLPGLGSLYSDPGLGARIMRLVYRPLQTIACHWADLTVFQNADDAREFEQLGVVRRSRLAIIPGSGVRTEFFAPAMADGTARARGRAELGISGTGIVVAMVSRILRSKGVLDFAAAARDVARAQPSIHFLLVGPADDGSIDALSADELRALRESVTWVGARKDIKEILASADIFVFPSFYREGVPRVLLEAASMALPLVAADCPGSRDVVDDGVNGFLVPPKDPPAIAQAVLRLSRRPELRANFGERSRERAVSRFDLSVVADRTRTLYEELLRRKVACPPPDLPGTCPKGVAAA